MKYNNLKFEITGNLLEVADMTWHINTINHIYIGKSCMSQKGEYAIFIDGGFDVVELYYRTRSYDQINSEFLKLCKEINRVNINFNKIPGSLSCVDYGKVENIKLSKPIKDKLIITLKNKEEAIIVPINYECAKDRLKLALNMLKEVREIL